MTVNTVPTPSMTSSNSMSSGYCSLDDESEDYTFFTAKTSFFRNSRPAAKVLNQDNPHRDRWLCKIGTNSDGSGVQCFSRRSRSVERKWVIVCQ